MTEDRKVDQTQFGERGNCMAACLATILGVPLDRVPDFTLAGPDESDWWNALRAWLKGFGFGVFTTKADAYLLRQRGFLLVAGETPRGFMHATVWKDGKLWHDPHPDRTGITKPVDVDVLYPLDPAALVLREGSEK